MDATQEINAAIDRLVAALRLDQELRLAAVLQYQVHRATWSHREDLYREISRLLRHAQASQVSAYSDATSAQIDKILASIDGQTT